MPRGYRCVVIAIVGWLSLAAAQPKDAASQPTGGTNNQIAAALDNVATALQKPEKPSKHDEPCGPGDDQRSSDLCAQWKAADAAERTAQAAWWLGVIGTIIGALTLAAAWAAATYAKRAADHTETGAKEAKRAADAAERGLAQSDEITHAQLRAYVVNEGWTFSIAGDGRIVFDFKMRNGGQTPAEDVRGKSEIWLIIKGKRGTRAFECQTVPAEWDTMGPGDTFSSSIRVKLSPGKIRAIKARIAQFEVTYIVSYRDIFGESWVYSRAGYADYESFGSGKLYNRHSKTRGKKQRQQPQAELPLGNA